MVFLILKEGANFFNRFTIEYASAAPFTTIYRNQRNDEISHSWPFDAAHGHVDRAACRDDLFKAILSHIAVFDRVGGDECGEAVQAQEGINAAQEENNQLAQANGCVLPPHIFAEGVAIGAAQGLPAQIRRISQNAVEAAVGDDVGKFEEPMERAFAFGHSPCGGGGLALKVATGEVVAKCGVGDEAVFVSGGFGEVELGDGYGGELAQEECVGALEFLVAGFFLSDLGGRGLGQVRNAGEVGGEGLALGAEVGREALLTGLVVGAFGFVGFAEGGSDVFVITGEGFEGFVGDAFFEFVAGHEADDGVAAFDVVVEEIEGFAGRVGFQPEGDLAQLDGKRVEVHPVDAVADDIANGLAEGGGAGLVVARAEDGEFGGNAAGGGEEDVAGAAGDVGNA